MIRDDTQKSKAVYCALHHFISHRVTLYDALYYTEDAKTPVSKARPASAATTPKKPEAKVETTVVQVPDMDDAASFFTPTAKQEDIEVTSDDFDHIFIESANP